MLLGHLSHSINLLISNYDFVRWFCHKIGVGLKVVNQKSDDEKIIIIVCAYGGIVGCSQAPKIEADSSEEQAKTVWQQHIKHTTHYDEALYEIVITQYAGTDLAKKAV